MKYTYAEIKKPTIAGTYYYQGTEDWQGPIKVIVENYKGELTVRFPGSAHLSPPKLNDHCWPASAKWFSSKRTKSSS